MGMLISWIVYLTLIPCSIFATTSYIFKAITVVVLNLIDMGTMLFSKVEAVVINNI